MLLASLSDLPVTLNSERQSFLARIAGLNLAPEAISFAMTPLLPRGKPTMTNRSKWSDKNQDYLRVYCGTLLSAFNRITKFESCRAIQVLALFPCPSKVLPWSLQDTKPDASNILKGVEDALIRLDQRISYAECLKFYAPEGGLVITLIDAT